MSSVSSVIWWTPPARSFKKFFRKLASPVGVTISSLDMSPSVNMCQKYCKYESSIAAPETAPNTFSINVFAAS
jgi:hypothetical protein